MKAIKYMLVRSFLLLLLFSGELPAQVISRYYQVLSGDKLVGEVQAKKQILGESIEYEVHSEVTLSMVISVRVSYKVKAVFLNGMLQTSSAIVYLNGSLKNKVDVARKNGYYEVVIDGDAHRIDGSITASSASLYFEKPGHAGHVFSETSGVLKRISTLTDGQLLLVDPDKDSEVNRYLYTSNTLLKSIEIERFMVPTLLIKHVRDS